VLDPKENDMKLSATLVAPAFVVTAFAAEPAKKDEKKAAPAGRVNLSEISQWFPMEHTGQYHSGKFC